MTKEYKAEIRTLTKAEKKLDRDYKVLERSVRSAISKLNKQLVRGHRATSKERTRIQRRRSILEGRLA